MCRLASPLFKIFIVFIQKIYAYLNDMPQNTLLFFLINPQTAQLFRLWHPQHSIKSSIVYVYKTFRTRKVCLPRIIAIYLFALHVNRYSVL